MSDYRIDVRGAMVLEGMKTGNPTLESHVVASIQLVRYGRNGNELKPVLLWGPAIMYPNATNGDIVRLMAPIFEQVVARHQAGEETQVPFVGISPS